MFLGHYGVALGAKRATSRISLGTLILAAQFLDLIWPIFLLLGVEHVRIVPGLMEASALEFEHYPYSHSLLSAIGWGVLLGLGYYAVRRYAAGAVLVGALVVSHWLLDLPMHQPDLPLWPGSEIEVGLGLWDSIPATLLLEFGLLALGLAVYMRTTKATDRTGTFALWGLVALLVFFYVGSLLGPPPPSEQTIAVMGLGLWAFVPWGYWIDRHRTARSASGGA